MSSHKYFDDNFSNLNVDDKYTWKFNTKEKENHQKRNCKAQRDSDSETDDSSECEFAEVENPEFDLDFFRVLAAIRTNDPLLKEDKPLMKASYSSVSYPKEKKAEEKPFTLREFEAKVILERGGLFEDVNNTSCHPVDGGDTSEEGHFKFDDNLSPVEDDDDLFNKKKDNNGKENKEKEIKEKEVKENAAIEFLRGKRASLPSKKDEKLLKNLKEDWAKNMSKSDKILMDYFVNQRFLEEDKDESERKILDIVPLEEDEKLFDEMEQFETKQRFRFEKEKNEESGNPVLVKALVEKKKIDKKEHPQSMDEFIFRMEDEEEPKSEVLNKVPVGKKVKKTITDKLEQVETERKFRFQEPHGELIRPHPRQIRESLRSTKSKRKARERERKRRVLEEKEKKKQERLRLKASKKKEILQRIERLKAEAGQNLFGDGINLDGEFDPDQHDKNMAKMFNKEYYEDEGTNPKPVFDDEELNLELEREYEKLEALEMMPEGDYKYMEVTPNSYGLTTEEILLADEEELKVWCPLSRLLRFHETKEEELSEIAFFNKRAKRRVKTRLLSSLFEKTEVPEPKKMEAEKRKNHDKKKERKRRNRKEIRLETLNMTTVNDNLTEDQQTLEKWTESKDLLDEELKKNLIQNGMMNEEEPSTKEGNYEGEIKEEWVLDFDESRKKKKQKQKIGKNYEKETAEAKCSIDKHFVKGNGSVESENDKTNYYEKKKTVTETEAVLQYEKVKKKKKREREEEEIMEIAKEKKQMKQLDKLNMMTLGDDPIQEQQTQEKTVEFEDISNERIVKKMSKKKKRLEKGMESKEGTREQPQDLEESRENNKGKRKTKKNSFNSKDEYVAKENAYFENAYAYEEIRTNTDTKPDEHNGKQKNSERKKKDWDKPFNKFNQSRKKAFNFKTTRFQSNNQNSNLRIMNRAGEVTDSRIYAYGVKPCYARHMLKHSVQTGTS